MCILDKSNKKDINISSSAVRPILSKQIVAW